MLSVRGIFQDGVAQPVAPLTGREGQAVIITFLDDPLADSDHLKRKTDWDALMQLIQGCVVETGISDLAHQHDHYLYNKPKRERLSLK